MKKTFKAVTLAMRRNKGQLVLKFVLSTVRPSPRKG